MKTTTRTLLTPTVGLLTLVTAAAADFSGRWRAEIDTPIGLQDSKPASSNIIGQQYPRIDSELRASFRLKAPDSPISETSATRAADSAAARSIRTPRTMA